VFALTFTISPKLKIDEVTYSTALHCLGGEIATEGL